RIFHRGDRRAEQGIADDARPGIRSSRRRIAVARASYLPRLAIGQVHISPDPADLVQRAGDGRVQVEPIIGRLQVNPFLTELVGPPEITRVFAAPGYGKLSVADKGILQHLVWPMDIRRR